MLLLRNGTFQQNFSQKTNRVEYQFVKKQLTQCKNVFVSTSKFRNPEKGCAGVLWIGLLRLASKIVRCFQSVKGRFLEKVSISFTVRHTERRTERTRNLNLRQHFIPRAPKWPCAFATLLTPTSELQGNDFNLKRIAQKNGIQFEMNSNDCSSKWIQMNSNEFKWFFFATPAQGQDVQTTGPKGVEGGSTSPSHPVNRQNRKAPPNTHTLLTGVRI